MDYSGLWRGLTRPEQSRAMPPTCAFSWHGVKFAEPRDHMIYTLNTTAAFEFGRDRHTSPAGYNVGRKPSIGEEFRKAEHLGFITAVPAPCIQTRSQSLDPWTCPHSKMIGNWLATAKHTRGDSDGAFADHHRARVAAIKKHAGFNSYIRKLL